jgi:hypothetical protein
VCGVIFVTYEGHGSVASLAFFTVWLCFFLALDIASTNILLFFIEKDRQKEQRKNTGRKSGSEVEDVDMSSDGRQRGDDEDQQTQALEQSSKEQRAP